MGPSQSPPTAPACRPLPPPPPPIPVLTTSSTLLPVPAPPNTWHMTGRILVPSLPTTGPCGHCADRMAIVSVALEPQTSHLKPPPPPTGNSPSPGQPTPGVVKHDKSSRGSVDTTKTRSGPQRVRMCSGERPIGAAKGKQPNTEALCQTPPPHLLRTDTPCSTMKASPVATPAATPAAQAQTLPQPTRVAL